MANSNRNTNFGPRVSFTTMKSDAGPVHVLIPSHASFRVEGRQFSAITTASLTSATLQDGEWAIGGHSANSIVLYVRSGVTIYEFANIRGGVL